MQVLFVCSGNICRSPLAEELFRQTLAKNGGRGFLVSSAGTLGIQGRPASRHSVQVGREHGVDLSRHRSRGLSAGLLRRADLVIVMERGHRHLIEQDWPEESSKIHLLRQFEQEAGEGASRDVFDPIGRPLEDYRACATVISRCVLNLVRHLQPGP